MEMGRIQPERVGTERRGFLRVRLAGEVFGMSGLLLFLAGVFFGVFMQKPDVLLALLFLVCLLVSRIRD